MSRSDRSASRSPADADDQPGDADPVDFTVLDGIGPKTADALIKVGVTSMADLASSNVYELARRLDEAGSHVPVSRIVSHRWLFQAWDLMAGSVENADVTRLDDGDGDGDGSNTVPVTQEPCDDWEEAAVFIVAFDRRHGATGAAWRTRVWDTKALVEQVVDGTDPSDWGVHLVDSLGH